jgi:hypothetical protein
MHTERPMEATAIDIFDDILDILKSLFRPIDLTCNCALRSSGLNACCGAASLPQTLTLDMCRSSSTRQCGAGLHFRHLFVDQSPAASDCLESKARISPIRNSNGFDRALSPECHISRRSFSAVHRHPAAQLIFADLAGMFMVNVVAGGRSYRNNVIAALASRRSGVWRSFR